MNRYTHTLQRVSKSEKSGPIRTGEEVIEGFYYDAPKIGDGFKFYGDGLMFGSRQIYTSDLESIDGNKFTTRSGSVYELLEIKED